MKKIIIEENELAQLCAHIVAEEKEAPAVAKEVGIIFLAKLGAALFDGVEDGQTVLVRVKRRR